MAAPVPASRTAPAVLLHRFAAVIVRAGRSRNGVEYPADVLRTAAPLFEGRPIMARPDADHVRGGPDVRAIVGWLREVRFVPATGGQPAHLAGTVTLTPGPLADTLAAAARDGAAGLVGLSLVAEGDARPEPGGRRTATRITRVESVDLVVSPAAGGGIVTFKEAAPRQGTTPHVKEASMDATVTTPLTPLNPGTLDPAALRHMLIAAILRLFPDQTPEALAQMTDAELATLLDLTPDPTAASPTRVAEAVAEGRRLEATLARIDHAGLPAAAVSRLRASFARRARFAEAEVDAAIAGERAYLAALAPPPAPARGMPPARVTETQAQKHAARLDAFFAGGQNGAWSFREAYVAITGDRRVTGRLDQCDRVRLAEAATGDFAALLGDALTRRLQADYRRPTVYDLWRRIADVMPVTDFRSQFRGRIGGYGDLPIVAEGSAYLAQSTPAEEEASYTVAKRGGLEVLTLEAIRNDDVGLIRRIPTAMAGAAKRTLAKFVFDLIRSNPVLAYDDKRLFSADHGNLGADPLDATSLAAARQRMQKQTELTSGDRLAIPPRSLLVPMDLEETAKDLFSRNTNNDPSFINSLSLDVLPVWYWTNAEDWFLAADPADIAGLEIGFLDNEQEPALFVQDSPTVGSLFANDTITYKIRHIYGGTVTDHRAFDGSFVV